MNYNELILYNILGSNRYNQYQQYKEAVRAIKALKCVTRMKIYGLRKRY